MPICPEAVRRPSILFLAALLTAPAAMTQQEPEPTTPAATSQRIEHGAQLGDFLVPLHTAEADMGTAYGVWAAGSRFKVSFHDGATFVPMLGDSYPHNLPLAWRTSSVRVGETELVTQAPRLAYAGYHAEYDLGGLTEAYDVRSEGIEQTFVLARPPATAGDLVIRGVVETALHTSDVGAAHQALAFCDDLGKELVVYGAATAIDARGHRQPMTTSCANGEITLRLDAAWLATAAFPLVIDPLLGPGTQVNTSTVREVDVVRENSQQNSNAAVWVAWSISSSASDQDVYVRRWNDDGTLAPFAYSDITASWSTSDPHGTYVRMVDYVVISFDRFFSSSQQRYVRYHRHDRADLTSNTTFGAISATDNAWRTDVSGVVYNGPNPPQALVVWQQEANLGGAFTNTSSSGIYGCYLDVLAGTAGTPFVIASGSFTDNERPSLCTSALGTSSGWAIAYQTYSSLTLNDDWDVAVRQIDLLGGVTAAMLIDNASPDHKMAPIIEGQNPDFLVAFTTSTLAQQPGKPAGVNGHQIRAVRVQWSYVDPIGTEPYGTVVLQSNADARLELAGLGFDTQTDSHWTLMFRSNTSEILYARTVGYHGIELYAETVFNPAGSDVSVRGGVSFDAYNGRYVLAYGVSGTNNYVTFDRLVYPSVTPWSTAGVGCSPATISWYGSQLIGTADTRVLVTGGPIGSLHVLAMATAPASALLFGIPPFVNGCWLLVPNAGPDYVGIVDVGIGHLAQWHLPLPEFLVSDTFYFQDFHTDSSGTFSLVSTQRLEVPIVK